jgi:hypothetical protein
MEVRIPWKEGGVKEARLCPDPRTRIQGGLSSALQRAGYQPAQ